MPRRVLLRDAKGPMTLTRAALPGGVKVVSNQLTTRGSWRYKPVPTDAKGRTTYDSIQNAFLGFFSSGKVSGGGGTYESTNRARPRNSFGLSTKDHYFRYFCLFWGEGCLLIGLINLGVQESNRIDETGLVFLIRMGGSISLIQSTK